MAKTKYTILIGNPGTGKSTLLNGLVGKVVFKSGWSPGEGMTQVLQLHRTDDGEVYGDTPGLADPKIRVQAAQEISAALKSGEGEYKLVFVVTLEAGRVRPSDGVTMKLVLDALPKDRKIPYGVIVNKILPKTKVKLLNNEKGGFDKVRACLNEGRENPTAYIHLYEQIDDLVDEDNALHAPETLLLQWLSLLPSVLLKPDDVDEVKAREFDAIQEQLEGRITELVNNNEVLKAKVEEQSAEMQEQVNAMMEKHEAAMAKQDEEFQAKIVKMEKDMDQKSAEEKARTKEQIDDMKKAHSEERARNRQALKDAKRHPFEIYGLSFLLPKKNFWQLLKEVAEDCAEDLRSFPQDQTGSRATIE